MNKKHLLLIDGMALLFRSFYATAVSKQFMINRHGLPTNAVQGYVKHILTAMEKIEPSHVAVCWDLGSVTFRNDLYADYKANRQAPPIEMIPQFDLAKEVTEAFGISNIGLAGYEADDCLGTIAQQLKTNMMITIVTGDRDLLQVLDDQVNVYLLKNGIGHYNKYSKDRFMDEYGIHPRQLIDMKALMGDSSDGYPGVKGIGEKTALKLIQQFEHVDGLLEHLHVLSPSVQKRINNDIDMLHLSRQLATIKCDVPLVFEIEQTLWKSVPQSAHAFVEEYELKMIRNHLLKYEEALIANQMVENH